MKGKRRAEEDMKDSLVLEEDMIVEFPLVPVSTFGASASRFFYRKKKSNNHIVEIQKDPT